MISVRIIKRLDGTGKFTIPKKLRTNLDIKHKDKLEFEFDNNRIVIRKYQPRCIFCGEENETIVYAGKHVCSNCIKEFRR